MQDLLICLKTLWGPTPRITSKLYYRKANHSWKLIGKGRLVKSWWLWVSGVTRLGPWWVNLYAQTKPNQTEPKPKQTKTHSHQKTPTTNLKQTPTKGKKKGGGGEDALYSSNKTHQIFYIVLEALVKYEYQSSKQCLGIFWARLIWQSPEKASECHCHPVMTPQDLALDTVCPISTLGSSLSLDTSSLETHTHSHIHTHTHLQTYTQQSWVSKGENDMFCAYAKKWKGILSHKHQLRVDMSGKVDNMNMSI